MTRPVRDLLTAELQYQANNESTMSALSGTLKAFVFGSSNGQKVYQNLQAADVPVTTADCRSCADPCDQGEHPQHPFHAQYH